MQDLFNIKNETSLKDEFSISLTKTNVFSISLQDSKNSVEKFFCEKCKKSFTTAGNLRNHIKFIHENNRPYKCSFPNCNKAYGVRKKLIIHERTHTGLRPFICPICQKSFNQKGNLKAHLKFHSEIRPFKCPLCNKDYKTSGHLKDHISIQHNHIKKFPCQYCNKRFGRNAELKAHLKRHAKIKNFVCKLEGCGKRFAEKRNMEQHYERHLKKMGIENTNLPVKKPYGLGNFGNDIEEKVKNALNELRDRNIEQKLEDKIVNKKINNKKETLNKNRCKTIKKNDKINSEKVNDSFVGNFAGLKNYINLMDVSKINKTKKLNGVAVCLKEENICDDNDVIVNNINNNNNSIDITYNNYDTFNPVNFCNIRYINNDDLELGINKNDLNENNAEF